MLELSVTFASELPAESAAVEGVRVNVPGALAEAGEGVSHELLLVAVQGMLPEPVFCTETVTGDGDEPVGLKRYRFAGVTLMTAVGSEETVKVTAI